MRMMIIGLAALLVIGGSAAGAYLFFMKDSKAATGPNGQAQEVASKSKDKDEKEDDGFLGNEFVQLDPLILPIVDGNGVSQTVSMVIALEVKNMSRANKVKKLSPKLKDAYIQDMYGLLSRHAAMKGGVLQVGMLKARLNKITDTVMGDHEIVEDVLLQVVQQRPI